MTEKIISPANKLIDKAAVRKVLDDCMEALTRKDVKALLSHYAAELVAFDTKPPFQTKGAVAWRHTWEACIGYFPDKFSVEMRDVTIHVSGDLAFAHHLFRLTGPDKDHPAMQTWMRATTGLKRQQGKWKIVHEHGSVPFNPHTMQALFTLDID